MSQVTIKGVDKKLWEETLIEVIKNRGTKKGNQTMGEMVNEGLRLRQDKKAKESK